MITYGNGLRIAALALLAIAGVGATGHQSGEGVSGASACLLREDTTLPGDALSAALLRSVPNYLSEMRGQQWNKDVVRLRLVSDDAKRKSGQAEAIIANAARLWNQETGAIVRLEWTTGEDADIEVRFAPQSTLPARAVGRTDTQFRSLSRTLLHAEITLSEGMSDARLLQVAAHEIGHALGLSGHSPSTDDLMYPVAHTPARVTERDRNTLCLNYQAAPPPSPPSPPSPAATPASPAAPVSPSEAK